MKVAGMVETNVLRILVSHTHDHEYPTLSSPTAMTIPFIHVRMRSRRSAGLRTTGEFSSCEPLLRTTVRRLLTLAQGPG